METRIVEGCPIKKIANAVKTNAAYWSQCVPDLSTPFYQN